jgi:hypothetical protein
MPTSRACQLVERICAALLAVIACAISLIGLRLQWGAAQSAAILVLALVSVAAGGWFVQVLFKVFDRCSQGCSIDAATKKRPNDPVGHSDVGRSDWSGSAARVRPGSPKHV